MLPFLFDNTILYVIVPNTTKGKNVSNIDKIQMTPSKVVDERAVAWNLSLIMPDEDNIGIGTVEIQENEFLVNIMFNESTHVCEDHEEITDLLTNMFCPRPKQIN